MKSDPSTPKKTDKLRSGKRPTWDINDVAKISMDDIKRTFKKGRHLYLCHAVPIVRDDLEGDVRYKDPKAEILL